MAISRLLKFGIKAGIMSSTVYLTIDKGIWKDNETTGQLYEELQGQIKPIIRPVIDQIPFELPELPRAGDVTSTAKTAWNKAVMASCLFLVEVPGKTWNYLKKGSLYTYEKINDQLKAFNEVENEKSLKPTS